MIEDEKVDFLKIHKDSLAHIGFWNELGLDTMIYAVEGLYKKEILKEFKIVDFVINGDTGLIKWEKRAKPLTDKEIKLMYGS